MKPEEEIAAVTRSRLSFTEASGRPTIKVLSHPEN
jgi:hypothetical protein